MLEERGWGLAVPERSADWLAQAERDLEMARVAAQNGFFEWACFIAQQAAEKAVKGLYQHYSGEARGHSLRDLLKLITEKIAIPDDLVEKAQVLDKYYIQPRYPNGFDRGAPKDYYTQREAEQATANAEAIIRFCNRLVSGRP